LELYLANDTIFAIKILFVIYGIIVLENKMKLNKMNVRLNLNLRSTIIFETPPVEHWIQVKEYVQYRSLIDIDQDVLNTIAEVIEDTKSEYKIMFINGQSGWVWKDNCAQVKNLN